MALSAKINKLVAACKGSVTISFNEHTTNYSSVKEELEGNFNGMYGDIPLEIKEKMIELDTMVEVHFYPNTPIGFYAVYNHNLNDALDEALSIVDKSYGS